MEREIEIHNSPQYRKQTKKNIERETKWIEMLSNWQQYHTGNKQSKLKSRIRKGIPPSFRSRVWKKLANIDILDEYERNDYYRKLASKTPVESFKATIDRDIDRTFPKHSLFLAKSLQNQLNGTNNDKYVLFIFFF